MRERHDLTTLVDSFQQSVPLFHNDRDEAFAVLEEDGVQWILGSSFA